MVCNRSREMPFKGNLACDEIECIDIPLHIFVAVLEIVCTANVEPSTARYSDIITVYVNYADHF